MGCRCLTFGPSARLSLRPLSRLSELPHAGTGPGTRGTAARGHVYRPLSPRPPSQKVGRCPDWGSPVPGSVAGAGGGPPGHLPCLDSRSTSTEGGGDRHKRHIRPRGGLWASRSTPCTGLTADSPFPGGEVRVGGREVQRRDAAEQPAGGDESDAGRVLSPAPRPHPGPRSGREVTRCTDASCRRSYFASSRLFSEEPRGCPRSRLRRPVDRVGWRALIPRGHPSAPRPPHSLPGGACSPSSLAAAGQDTRWPRGRAGCCRVPRVPPTCSCVATAATRGGV